MTLPTDKLGSWENRVRFSVGPDGFAYRPRVFAAPATDEAANTIAAVLGSHVACQKTGRTAVDYEEWAYNGDVLRAVEQLRLAGLDKAQPVHVFFADHAPGVEEPRGIGANPVYANPVYANPVYANPVYANPVYANPVYANPVYANPVYANPVYANPVYANPVYANPVYANADGRLGGSVTPVSLTPMNSLVYPNPVYANERLQDRELARRYRASGGRPSQARPTTPVSTGPPTDVLDDLTNWDGNAVRVAVIDTGLASTLTGAMSPSEAVDDFDWDGDGYLDPVAGHGTFIAGLIRRVAPEVAVGVVQALSSFGDGDEMEVCCQISDLCSSDIPPHIISLSFSGYTLEKPNMLKNALKKAQKKGIVVVASAGNDGIDREAYPAAFPGVIAVAALGPEGPAAFSNHGDWVDACAPGVDLTSFFFSQDGDVEREYGYDEDSFKGWASWSGTSFAAPNVAGAIARRMAITLLVTGTLPSATTTAALLIDQPGLLRIPGYGTVVNVAGVSQSFEW